MKRQVTATVMVAMMGIGVWGIMEVETEEATASVTQTFVLRFKGNQSGNCISSSDMERVVFTRTSDETSFSVTTNDSNDDYSPAGDVGGKGYNPFVTMVITDPQGTDSDNIMGQAYAVGWSPARGDHTGTSISYLGYGEDIDCDGFYHCNTGESGPSKKYVAASGGTVGCLYTGDF